VRQVGYLPRNTLFNLSENITVFLSCYFLKIAHVEMSVTVLGRDGRHFRKLVRTFWNSELLSFFRVECYYLPNTKLHAPHLLWP